MTLKVSQDHWKWSYFMGYISHQCIWLTLFLVY